MTQKLSPKGGTETITARLRRGYEAETIPKTGTKTAQLRHGYDAETSPKTGTETAEYGADMKQKRSPKQEQKRPDNLDIKKDRFSYVLTNKLSEDHFGAVVLLHT